MVERLIITGLINNTEFLQQIRPTWDPEVLGSASAQQIASWCIEFFDEFGTAPARNIEDIYFEKKEGGDIPRDMVEEIREDLEDLASEYDESFNVKYALKRARKYFTKRQLENHQKELENLIAEGNLDAADDLARSYRPRDLLVLDDLDLSGSEVLLKVENAFMAISEPLLEYPGALGNMLNQHMVRGGFVSYMAREKLGKSFRLLEDGVRGTMKRNKVAFFQAGDMTEAQQLKRIGSYLTKKPIHEKYLGEIFLPHEDCLKNQLDLCDREERQDRFGVFTGGEFDEDDIRKSINKEALLEAHLDFGSDYRPCTNCEEFHNKSLGVPWLKPVRVDHVLTVDEAKRKFQQYFIDKNRRFKISTHPNNTLTIKAIKNILMEWERKDGFVPDIIIIDYADLLVAEHTKEFRHAQNEIWKDLRALSQERDCLVLTATQADAKSYEKNLITMSNFSEDKRKFAHVTAMFGLNQDKYGREKKMGLMRVNELVVREGEFDVTSSVTVLQNLTLGRPFLGSYI